MASYVIGVDVGTGSVRAALFDENGKRYAVADRPIRMNKPRPLHVEQSSDDIWAGVVACVRSVVTAAGVAVSDIRAIGFDATCSLVVLGEGGLPLPVGDPSRPERNIIVWMDHRALEQAERINALGHPVLNYVGGRISPEMQTPRLL